jgi:protein-S-isoprenylcysteine O-methyltransferase Ste14
MWLGFRRLGWARMMKIRLFSQLEATWIHTGIFKFCRDPMDRGSQLSMFGMSLLLDSWVILLYVAEMVLLQQFLILLEREPVPTTLVDYLTLNSINPKS